MRLTPWEEERLLVFGAAQLARRHREAWLPLNAPEAVALICDAMLDAARSGRTFAEVEAAGLAAVSPSDVLPGVRELVDLVSLEVLLEDGTRLISLVDPLARGAPADPFGPGAIVAPPERASEDRTRERLERRDRRQQLQMTVRNTSRRVVRVSSHFPFDQVNPRLLFDRAAARGFRLDIEAGSSERWAPSETRTVVLVRFGGAVDATAEGQAESLARGTEA
jgi:urease subunit gamma/beta